MYPYILDATGKSIQWIAAHFKATTVEITSQSEDKFANILDLAIRLVHTFYLARLIKHFPFFIQIWQGSNRSRRGDH